MPIDLRKLTRNGRPLSAFDYKLALDMSGSMGDRDGVTHPDTRWGSMEKTVFKLAAACDQVDDDGIDAYFFDDRVEVVPNTTAGKVAEAFQKRGPRGSTDTAGVLKYIFDDYFQRRDGTPETTSGVWPFKRVVPAVPGNPNVKPLIIALFTDGAPNSQSALRQVIIEATKKLRTADEIVIIFIQVGDNDTAKKALNELDEGLVKLGAKYDIVSVYTVDAVRQSPNVEDLLVKALTAAS